MFANLLPSRHTSQLNTDHIAISTLRMLAPLSLKFRLGLPNIVLLLWHLEIKDRLQVP